jgi:hypothetical protein
MGWLLTYGCHSSAILLGPKMMIYNRSLKNREFFYMCALIFVVGRGEFFYSFWSYGNK